MLQGMDGQMMHDDQQPPPPPPLPSSGHPDDQALFRQRQPASINTDGPPVLVKKRQIASPGGSSRGAMSGDDDTTTPIAAQLVKKLDTVTDNEVERAEVLISALGNDSSKDVGNVRRILISCSEEGVSSLDIAIRALFLSILNYDCVRRSIPTRVLNACSKASRIPSYRCMSEVLRELVATRAWETCSDVWDNVADCIADCCQSNELLQKSSLSDLCKPLSRTEEWGKFRRALADSLMQVCVVFR